MYQRFLICVLFSLAISLTAGCGPEVVPCFPPANTQPPKPDAVQIVPAPAVPVFNAAELPADSEIWSVIYMQGQKVGYMHVAGRLSKEGDQQYLHQRANSEVKMLREGRALTQKIVLQTWEDSAGRVQRFESRMTSGGPGEILVEGRAGQGGMIVTTTTQGKAIKKFLAWPEKCGGYFAVEQSLEQKPLKAGETRTVSSLIPGFNLPGETVLTALEEEEVDLRGLKQKLLKIKQEIKNIPGQTAPITSFCWINAKGEMLKTFEPSFQQEAYRTTQELALRQDDLGSVDLLVSTTVKLKGELPKGRPLKQATYLAKLKDEKLADQFATDEFQQVEKIDDHSVRLQISQLDPSSKVNEQLRGEKPKEEDSAPNSLIQSDDPAVKELANQIVPEGVADPIVIALALEKGVRAHIHKRNYGQAFATAAEVVRSQEGDCTEHSVLLAAVCRAKKIPARVVLGLVYYPQQSGFAYHMWNEVWIGDRWLPLDATVAQGTVGADHIKLRHSSLHGETALAVMLPLLQVVNRLELEVVETE